MTETELMVHTVPLQGVFINRTRRMSATEALLARLQAGQNNQDVLEVAIAHAGYYPLTYKEAVREQLEAFRKVLAHFGYLALQLLRIGETHVSATAVIAPRASGMNMDIVSPAQAPSNLRFLRFEAGDFSGLVVPPLARCVDAHVAQRVVYATASSLFYRYPSSANFLDRPVPVIYPPAPRTAIFHSIGAAAAGDYRLPSADGGIGPDAGQLYQMAGFRPAGVGTYLSYAASRGAVDAPVADMRLDPSTHAPIKTITFPPVRNSEVPPKPLYAPKLPALDIEPVPAEVGAM